MCVFFMYAIFHKKKKFLSRSKNFKKNRQTSEIYFKENKNKKK